jgi:TRAP-type mannitol/chloroaromatic compound transport system permease large subunit
MSAFVKRATILGLLSLLVLVPLLWLLIVPVVTAGGALTGQLFDRFGDVPRIVGAYAGLLMTIVLVLVLLAAPSGVVLATLFGIGRKVFSRRS